MAHDHSFDCRICGAHLDSQRELDQHNRDEHGGQSAGSGQGGREGPNDAQGKGRNESEPL